MKIISSEKEYLLPIKHTLFNHCHASSLVQMPDGELICAFFAGLREGEKDVAIWLSHTRHGIWRKPVRLMAETGFPHWNPILHTEGDTVWLFYKVGKTVHDWITRWSVSHDQGKSWRAPEELVSGSKFPRGPVKNKLIVMSNGEWAAPGSIETEQNWDAFVDISADKGKQWSRFDVPIEHQASTSPNVHGVWHGLADNALWETDIDRVFKWDGVIQPSLWESNPGMIHMLMRSTRGYIYRSDSNDFGRSWNHAYVTPLPNNNSGIDLVCCHDGTLILAYNPIAGNWGRRYPISLCWSTDNGLSWSEPFDLEAEEGEFSYPAIICEKEGNTIHLTYTCNRKNIAYQKIIFG